MPDKGNNVMLLNRKVLLVTLFVGLLLATFMNSSGYAESVLITDNASVNPTNRILQFSAITGDFERVVVDSNAGLDGPGGMVLHPTRGTLLVTSFNRNSVMEFDLLTGQKLSEFGSNELLKPVALDVHPTRGTLLVSGRDNRGILEYSPDGQFIGMFATDLSVDYAFGFDFDHNNGSLLLANWDFGGGSLIQFDLETGSFINEWNGAIEPTDVLVHPLSGNILMDSNHEILEFDSDTGVLIGTFGVDPSFTYPSNLAWSNETNDLLVINRGSSQNVIKLDGVTGVFEGVLIPAGTGGLAGPQSMLVLVPEPASLTLLCLGSIAAIKRRRS